MACCRGRSDPEVAVEWLLGFRDHENRTREPGAVAVAAASSIWFQARRSPRTKGRDSFNHCSTLASISSCPIELPTGPEAPEHCQPPQIAVTECGGAGWIDTAATAAGATSARPGKDCIY
jgi:hypothetical protein